MSRSLAVALLMAATVPGTAVAQQPATPEGVGYFDALLDSVVALDSTITAIEEWMASVEGGDPALLEDRLRIRTQRRRELTRRMSDVALQMPDGEAETEARRALVDSLIRIDLEELLPRVLGLMGEASSMRAETETTAGDDLALLEYRIRVTEERIQEGFAAFLSGLRNLEALGEDVTDQFQQFDRALELRAELLSAQLSAAVTREAATAARVRAGATDLTVEQNVLRLQTTESVALLSSHLDLMDERGLETSEFRLDMLSMTGDLTASHMRWEVLGGMLREATLRAEAWVRQSGANALFKAILFLATLGVFYMLGRVARRIVAGALASSRVRVSRLMRDTILEWVARGFLLIGLLLALSQVGVDLGPVLAGLGVAGLVVGFALQDSLSNLAAGMLILLHRPFDVGDTVEVAGTKGKIARMSLVSTTLHTPDNQVCVIPNRKVSGDVIQNGSARRTRRVEITVRVGYEEDVARVEAILTSIAEGHELVLDKPPIVVKVADLAESSVQLIVRAWCHTEDATTVEWDLVRSVKLRFDEEGISIPFPQREIHVHPAGSESEDAATDLGGKRRLAGRR